MEIERFLRVKEVAEILKVRAGRVHELIAEGRLKSVKIGAKRLIKKEDLESLEIKKVGRPEVANPSYFTLAKRKSRKKKITER